MNIPLVSRFRFSSLVHCNRGAVRPDCISLLHWEKKSSLWMWELSCKSLLLHPWQLSLLTSGLWVKTVNLLLVHTNMYIYIKLRDTFWLDWAAASLQETKKTGSLLLYCCPLSLVPCVQTAVILLLSLQRRFPVTGIYSFRTERYFA